MQIHHLGKTSRRTYFAKSYSRFDLFGRACSCEEIFARLVERSPRGEADKMPDLRDILDWEYYKGRLRGAVQKIISLPAALQNVQNPCPGVVYPDWLNKRIRERNDPYQQKKIDSMMGFRKQTKDEYLEQLNFSEDDEEDNRNEDNNEDDNDERDMEDFGAARNTPR